VVEQEYHANRKPIREKQKSRLFWTDSNLGGSQVFFARLAFARIARVVAGDDKLVCTCGNQKSPGRAALPSLSTYPTQNAEKRNTPDCRTATFQEPDTTS